MNVKARLLNAICPFIMFYIHERESMTLDIFGGP